MRQVLVMTLTGIFLVLGLHGYGFTKEKATKAECIAKCQKAVELITRLGSEAAISRINQPDSGFQWKDSYVFIFETKQAKLLSHPAARFIGWPMLDYKSADGVFVFREIIKAIKKDTEGWISYEYLINQQPPAVPKTTYYIKVPNKAMVVAAGFYE